MDSFLSLLSDLLNILQLVLNQDVDLVRLINKSLSPVFLSIRLLLEFTRQNLSLVGTVIPDLLG